MCCQWEDGSLPWHRAAADVAVCATEGYTRAIGAGLCAVMSLTPFCRHLGPLQPPLPRAVWQQLPLSHRAYCIASLCGVFNYAGAFLVCLLSCVLVYRLATDRDGGKFPVCSGRPP